MNKYLSHKHFVSDIIGSEGATSLNVGNGESITVKQGGGLKPYTSDGLEVDFGTSAGQVATGNHFHSNYLTNGGDIVLSQNNGIYSIAVSSSLSPKELHRSSKVIVEQLGITQGTKIGVFDASNISNGQVRTLKFPDQDGTILVQSGNNQFVINDGIAPSGVNISSLTTVNVSSSYSSITVNWAFPNGYSIPSDLNYFIVAYRSEDNINWTEVPVMNKDALSTTIQNLIPGMLYYFKVLASDISNNRSAYSSISSINAAYSSTALSTPSWMTLTYNGGSWITISWEPVRSINLRYYEVYYEVHDGQPADINAIQPPLYRGDETSCFVQFTLNDPLYFKVCTVDWSGNRSPFQIVQLATDLAPTAPLIVSSDVTTGIESDGRCYVNISFTDGVSRVNSFFGYQYAFKRFGSTDWLYFPGPAGTNGNFRTYDIIPNTEYEISVAAVSNKGIVSTYTPLRGEFNRLLTAKDTIKPPKVTGVSASLGYSSLIVSWNASASVIDIDRYEVCVSTNAIFDPDIDPTVIKYAGLSSNALIPVSRGYQTYYIKVRAVDTSGNKGDLSDVISKTFDSNPGTPIINSPVASSNLLNNSLATISTSFSDGTLRSTENFAFYVWRIKRSSDQSWSEFTGTTSPSFTFNNLITNTSYSIEVKAVSNIGLSSGWTAVITTTTTKDSVAPVLTGLQLDAGYGSIIVSYSCTATDISHYNIYTSTAGSGFVMDTSSLKLTGNSTKVIINVGRGYATHWVKVQGYDTSGNPSNILSGFKNFDENPTIITSITATATPVEVSDTGSVTAGISATINDISRANTGFAYYEWKIKLGTDSVYSIFNGGTSLTYNFKGLLPNKDYNINVLAVNDTGLRSNYLGADITIKTNKNTAPPSAPTLFTVSPGFNNIKLNWTNPTNRDIELIEITRSISSNIVSGSIIASTAANYYVDNSAIYNQPYYYFIRAKNTSGHYSSYASAGPSSSIQLYPEDMSTDARVDFTMKDILFAFAASGSTTLNYTFPAGTGYIYRNGTAYSRAASGTLESADNKYIIATCISGSNTVSFRTIPFGTNLTSSAVSANEVVVGFTSSTQSSTGFYQCYVRQSNSMAVDGAIIQDATISYAKIKSLQAGQITADGILSSSIVLGGSTLGQISSNASSGSLAYTQTINYRNTGQPDVAFYSMAVTATPNQNASIDLVFSWVSSGGTSKPADQYVILFDSSSTTGINLGMNSPAVLSNATTGADSYKLQGVDAGKYYKFGILAIRKTTAGVEQSASISSPAEYKIGVLPSFGYNITGTIYGEPASSYNTLLTNYNVLNDNDNTPVSIPTFVTISPPVLNNDSTSNITVNWIYSQPASSIDGFRIYSYSASSNTAHAFSDSTIDQTITVPSNKKSYILFGAPSDQYYTFGIQAYRSVNTTVSSTGVLTSNIATAGPIQPSSSPNYKGLIDNNATIAGSFASVIKSWAASGFQVWQDPIARANNVSTKLLPGLVSVSGSAGNVTLDNWIMPDKTTINGGQIEANTISARSIVLNARGVTIQGVDFSYDAVTNIVSWTTGSIIYIDDSGTTVNIFIQSGNATWTSGTLYLYYIKGDSHILNTSDPAVSTGNDKICLATYNGGSYFIANYGGTIITGDRIVTGSIDANRIKANSITAQSGVIGSLAASSITAGKILGTQIETESITITNLATSAYNNPIYYANLNSTQLLPGKVLITSGAGSGSLATWIKPNTTEIDGGVIAANSIKARSLEISQRDIAFDGIKFWYNDPAANQLRWSSGTLRYPDTNGNAITSQIISGQSASASVVAPIYVYWSPVQSGRLLSTTIYETAASGDNIVVGTYSGNDNLNVNYGKTIITGSDIVTNTIDTNHLKANSITAAKIAANEITGDKIVSRTISASNIEFGTLTGDLIAANTISGNNIKAGTITAASLAIRTITGDRIGSTTISGDNIVTGTITSTHISAGSIVGTSIKSQTISADHIRYGSLTGDHIQANSINTSHIEILSKHIGTSENFDSEWMNRYAAGNISKSSSPPNITLDNNYNSITGFSVIKVKI